MASRVNFEGDLQENLEKFDKRSKAAILAITDAYGQTLEDYMRRNRPWTDRTGAAKARLNHSVEPNWAADKVRITLAHGVYYGVYLEFAMEKRFAIIYPTILTMGPGVVSSFNNTMRRLFEGR